MQAQNIRAVVRHVLSNDIAMQLEGVLWLNMYLIQIGNVTFSHLSPYVK